MERILKILIVVSTLLLAITSSLFVGCATVPSEQKPIEEVEMGKGLIIDAICSVDDCDEINLNE